jgi:hypothetical protein
MSSDTIPVVQQKAAFIQNKALGGAMFWEVVWMAQETKVSSRSWQLHSVGRMGFDKTPNQLLYPDSPFTNILKCAPVSTRIMATIISGRQSSPYLPQKALQVLIVGSLTLASYGACAPSRWKRFCRGSEFVASRGHHFY